MSQFPNIGSIKKMYCFSPDEIEVNTNNSNNTATVILLNDLSLDNRNIIFSKESITSLVKWEDDDNAGLWGIEISGSIPNTDEISKPYSKLLFQKCIIIVESLSGQMFVFGNNESPLFPKKLERVTPQRVLDNKNYSFALEGVSFFEPPELIAID